MSDAKAIKLQSFNNKLEVRVSINWDKDSGFAGVHGFFRILQTISMKLQEKVQRISETICRLSRKSTQEAKL